MSPLLVQVSLFVIVLTFIALGMKVVGKNMFWFAAVILVASILFVIFSTNDFKDRYFWFFLMFASIPAFVLIRKIIDMKQ
ncbi:hypothetical protein CEN49_27325 [Fischerella thermalis CCMEE 5273]|nr:hypothetical protein CEN49_27325 [Fischerella thermalis CCMEE 5273]